MLQPADLDARILEHRRRAHVANRRGWLRPSGPDAGRQITLGTVLGVVRVRVATSALVTPPHAPVPDPGITGMAPGR